MRHHDVMDKLHIDNPAILKLGIGHCIMHSDGIGVRLRDREAKVIMAYWDALGMDYDYFLRLDQG